MLLYSIKKITKYKIFTINNTHLTILTLKLKKKPPNNKYLHLLINTKKYSTN